MPLIYQKTDVEAGRIGIWEIRETEDFFIEALVPDKKILKNLELVILNRKMHWLAARYLVNHITGRDKNQTLGKDKYGKPFIMNSDLTLSISHSGDFVAAMVGKENIGLDIQFKKTKIRNIAFKFVHHSETNFIKAKNELDGLHAIWCAKEAIYKAYGEKNLSFKEHIRIRELNWEAEPFRFKGSLVKQNNQREYHLTGQSFNKYMMVYAVEM